MTQLLAFRPTALAMAALALSACEALTPAPPPPCPDVALVSDAATITKFVEGPGRDLTDVLYEAQLVNAAGACNYDVEKETGAGTLDVDMAVSMEMARGPANRDGRVAVRYFVALTGTDGEIIDRQRFEGVVEFIGNRSRLVWTDEPVYLAIPLKAGQTGSDFKIYVGYELSREEVEFNRNRTAGIRR
ncbi:MAG: hypothetical protein RBS99_01130 [Rhodospirillales bacterium]|jgi:hypothetical protein|nr:hypothetical protein [Rhodospirillales bacterium]